MQTRCNSGVDLCACETQPLTMSDTLVKHSVSMSPKFKRVVSPNLPTPSIRHHNSDAGPGLIDMPMNTTCSILRNVSDQPTEIESSAKPKDCHTRTPKTFIVEPVMPPRGMRHSHSIDDPPPGLGQITKPAPLRNVSKTFVQSPAPREVLISDESDQDGDTNDFSDEETGDDDDDVDDISSQSEDDDETGISENETGSLGDNRATGKTATSYDNTGASSPPRFPVRLRIERQHTVSGILGNKTGPETSLDVPNGSSIGYTRRSLVFVDQSQESQQRRQSLSSRQHTRDIGRRSSLSPKNQSEYSIGGGSWRNSSKASMKSRIASMDSFPNKAREPMPDFIKWRSRSMDAVTESSIVGNAIDDDHGPCSVWASQHLDVDESACLARPPSFEKPYIKARSAPLSGSSTRSNARSPRVGPINFPLSKPTMEKAEELALVAEKLLLHAHDDVEESNSPKNTTSEMDAHSSESENEDVPFNILPNPCNLCFYRETSMSVTPRIIERGPRRLSVTASVVPVPLGEQRGKSQMEPTSGGPCASISSSMSTSPRLQVSSNGISLVATPTQASSSTFVNLTNADGFTSPIPKLD